MWLCLRAIGTLLKYGFGVVLATSLRQMPMRFSPSGSIPPRRSALPLFLPEKSTPTFL